MERLDGLEGLPVEKLQRGGALEVKDIKTSRELVQWRLGRVMHLSQGVEGVNWFKGSFEGVLKEIYLLRLECI